LENRYDRRSLLQLAGITVGIAILEACSNGGGSGTTSSPPPDPRNFKATFGGSVRDNTALLFMLDEREVQSVNTETGEPFTDFEIFSVTRASDGLSVSDNIVFEVNGQREIGAGIAARHFQVNAGDTISWKSIS